MKALVERARTIDMGWKVSGFMVDDAAAEIDPIRYDKFSVQCDLSYDFPRP